MVIRVLFWVLMLEVVMAAGHIADVRDLWGLVRDNPAMQRCLSATLGGDYDGVLGHGGYGVVLGVRRAGNLIAVKLMPLERQRPLLSMLSQRTRWTMFEREHEVLKAMSGDETRPYSIQLLEPGASILPASTCAQTVDRPMSLPVGIIPMEYAAGGTLLQWMRGHLRARDASLAREWVLGRMSRALCALHARGFQHNDVKLSNFLVETGVNGQRSSLVRVMLSDYGMAAKETRIRSWPEDNMMLAYFVWKWKDSGIKSWPVDTLLGAPVVQLMRRHNREEWTFTELGTALSRCGRCRSHLDAIHTNVAKLAINVNLDAPLVV